MQKSSAETPDNLYQSPCCYMDDDLYLQQLIRFTHVLSCETASKYFPAYRSNCSLCTVTDVTHTSYWLLCIFLVSLYESRRDADFPEVRRRFSQSTQANVRTVPYIIPWPPPATYCLIYYSWSFNHSTAHSARFSTRLQAAKQIGAAELFLENYSRSADLKFS